MPLKREKWHGIFWKLFFHPIWGPFAGYNQKELKKSLNQGTKKGSQSTN